MEENSETKINHDPTCLFCRIGKGEISANFVHKDEFSFSIRDINPQAPTHILVIPREHKQNIACVKEKELLGELFQKACAVAAGEGLSQGFRLVVNTGEEGGQTVGHLHIHVIGGRPMLWPPG